MDRPYIICHMVTSIDGKVTGDFLYTEAGCRAAEQYYAIHRDLRADGFACGRVTMEGSFTGGWMPALSDYKGAVVPNGDFVADGNARFYALSFDRKGRLGWNTRRSLRRTALCGSACAGTLCRIPGRTRFG